MALTATIYDVFTVADAGTSEVNDDYYFNGTRGYSGGGLISLGYSPHGKSNLVLHVGDPNCSLTDFSGSITPLYKNDNADPTMGTWSNGSGYVGDLPVPTVTIKTSSGVPQGGMVLASFL